MLFVVPLTNDRGWQVLTYRNIPGHVVRFSNEGLEIRVRCSAGPIVYRLPTPVRVKHLRARGRIEGSLNLTAQRQGQPGFDDYALRLGLVEAGPRRLGFFERQFAPAWLRTLFSLASPHAGISRVRFLNVAIDPQQIGKRRRHPLSDLLDEEIVAAPMRHGAFTISTSFETPLNTIALWIGADGDDTASSFAVVLVNVELEGTDAH